MDVVAVDVDLMEVDAIEEDADAGVVIDVRRPQEARLDLQRIITAIAIFIIPKFIKPL